MSIFSSCVEAPYSGVITYIEISAKSLTSEPDCPIPDVSKIITSGLANFKTLMAERIYGETETLFSRVAIERI